MCVGSGSVILVGNFWEYFFLLLLCLKSDYYFVNCRLGHLWNFVFIQGSHTHTHTWNFFSFAFVTFDEERSRNVWWFIQWCSKT